MKLLAYLRSLASLLFRRSKLDDDMEEELAEHIQYRADDLQRTGLTRAEAERRARIEFGGRSRFKEECRDSFAGNFVGAFVSDAHYSLRVLRKSPGFAIVAVFTLALGIGANAVVFGLLDAIVLHPLNVPLAESLYGIQHGNEASSYQSYPDYLDLRDRNRSFDGLAAYSIVQAALDTGSTPSTSWGDAVSGNYFDVLGIQPYLGRFFHRSDEHGPNSAPYLVLGYEFWHSRFADDRGIVGRVVRLNKHPFTIIGVAPPEFHGTLLFGFPDFYAPLVDVEQMRSASIVGTDLLNARGNRWVFMTLGHLKAGVTPAQAIADLNSIGRYLEKTYPKDDDQRTFTLARPSLYGDFLGRPARAFLTALMLLSGLILLAACANLGSLFAARSADRSREVALRLALGSSRNRILRTLFTEALLISLAGGAAGLFASVALLRALSAWRPFPRFSGFHLPVSPDTGIYAIALILALISAILFGAVPVRQVLRTDPYQIVKAGSMGTIGRRTTMRSALLGVQIAICAVLVTSSMVAVRGLIRSLHSDLGFQPRNAMLLETSLEMAGYHGDAVPAMQKRMIRSIEKIPGVESVGLVDFMPLFGSYANGSHVFADLTTDLRPSNAVAHSLMYRISPEYLQAAATALLSGRSFTWHDDQLAPRVAVINNQFARTVFGSVSAAVGRYYKIQDGTRIQVVGVVEDGKYLNLTEDPHAAMFVPILQAPSIGTNLIVRSGRDPRQLAEAMRSTLRNLDPGLPSEIETWRQELDLALFPARLATVSLGVLGAMGAMLSITGIFGLAACSVSRRLKELGIRMALGARRTEVLKAALGHPVKLLICGSAAGWLLGVAASRVLAHIVYRATPRDPLVFAGVVLAMALLGALGTWLPAQRVLSLDPVSLLHEE